MVAIISVIVSIDLVQYMYIHKSDSPYTIWISDLAYITPQSSNW